ncbi:MAG: hypothetical protein HRT47_07600 [Candidatus Caenarcaniphilales bacterium]|nr:hypothetical protein [Candidatus Caenarcaniphilales bacterium]
MAQLSASLSDALTKMNLGKEELSEEYSALLNSYCLLLKSMNLLILKLEDGKQSEMQIQHKNEEVKANIHFLKNMAVGLSLNRPC